MSLGGKEFSMKKNSHWVQSLSLPVQCFILQHRKPSWKQVGFSLLLFFFLSFLLFLVFVCPLLSFFPFPCDCHDAQNHLSFHLHFSNLYGRYAFIMRTVLGCINLNLFLVSNVNVWHNIVFQEMCWVCIHKRDNDCIIKKVYWQLWEQKSSRTIAWFLLLLFFILNVFTGLLTMSIHTYIHRYINITPQLILWSLLGFCIPHWVAWTKNKNSPQLQDSELLKQYLCWGWYCPPSSARKAHKSLFLLPLSI